MSVLPMLRGWANLPASSPCQLHPAKGDWGHMAVLDSGESLGCFMNGDSGETCMLMVLTTALLFEFSAHARL